MGISNDLIKVPPLPTLFPPSPWPCAVTVTIRTHYFHHLEQQQRDRRIARYVSDTAAEE